MAVQGALRLQVAAVGGLVSRGSLKISTAPLNAWLLRPPQRQISLVKKMYLSTATQSSPSHVTAEKMENVASAPTESAHAVPVKDASGTSKPFKFNVLNHEDFHRPDLTHFRSGISKPADDLDVKKDIEDDGTLGQHALPHPIWTEDEVKSVVITHTPPKTITDKLAYGSVRFMRFNFDLFSGFKFGKRTERKWLQRIIFLETVAGVPGMVAAMTRHLHSLRRLKRDHGWIHTLLEEAENERMHLMTALQLKQPSAVFRMCVLLAQGTFVTLFSAAYLVSPKFCHRFVGYLEEEAVKTYTKCLEDFDSGRLPLWSEMEAPPVAKRYWNLSHDAMMRDVILAIRADEAHHRLVNHTLSDLDKDDPNPFQPGK